MRQLRGLVSRCGRTGPGWVVGLGAALALAGCTASSPSATSSPAPTSTTTTTTTTAPPETTGTSATTPPATSATSAPPTFFTPPATGGYSLSGAVSVEQARQDPFSNLLLRGALHQETVTLDVVTTPDAPVTAGRPSEILLGTCRCATRGQGLRVTVSDGAAVRDAGAGKVAIVGRFTVTRTAQDAVTLSPAA